MPFGTASTPCGFGIIIAMACLHGTQVHMHFYQRGQCGMMVGWSMRDLVHDAGMQGQYVEPISGGDGMGSPIDMQAD